mmetsp:Transcript_34774/g.95898  ORF Transcript_34774/g.95898 Transcript_34774/m.95898 type:complete len:213 (+) Transcript_34774:661-1299(+)
MVAASSAATPVSSYVTRRGSSRTSLLVQRTGAARAEVARSSMPSASFFGRSAMRKGASRSNAAVGPATAPSCRATVLPALSTTPRQTLRSLLCFEQRQRRRWICLAMSSAGQPVAASTNAACPTGLRSLRPLMLGAVFAAGMLSAAAGALTPHAPGWAQRSTSEGWCLDANAGAIGAWACTGRTSEGCASLDIECGRWRATLPGAARSPCVA